MRNVRPVAPIGRTQWAKWGPQAREAYNDMRKLGFTHETGVAEANAKQLRVNAERDAPPEPEPEAALDELIAMTADEYEAPPTELTKPRAPRKKKAE